MSEQGSLRYKKAKTALQEAQERLITNHMLDSANACQQGVEHISTLEAEVAEQAAEIAEIRETSKHINKIRMKEEAELESYKQALEEIKEIAELPPVDGAILRIATKTLAPVKEEVHNTQG